MQTLGKRVDIPRHIFLQLIAKASDEARRKLLLERPEAARDVEHMVCDVTGELHSIFGPASKSYYSARKTVSALHRCGALVEKKIFDFAQSHAFPEVTLALSMLCSLPANVIERGLIDRSGEMPMIFAKALDFSWETAMALLFLGAPEHKISAGQLDALEKKFSRLTAETAQSVDQFVSITQSGGALEPREEHEADCTDQSASAAQPSSTSTTFGGDIGRL